ncbi:hypothetical protein Tco_0054062 [Tanacetum coccineum]
MGTMWCLCDPTPSGWCKTDAHSMNFGLSKIDCTVGGKIRDKNAEESWEIIENLSLYDHEGWDDRIDFTKLNSGQVGCRKKVLVREEARQPVTKTVNAISLVKMEKEMNTENIEMVYKNIIELSELNAIELNGIVDIKNEVVSETHDEPIMNVREEPEELVEMPRSLPVGYYLKHEINEKLIECLVGNQRYNDSLLATRLGKMDHETYNSLPRGPMYNAILKKKITKTEDM